MTKKVVQVDAATGKPTGIIQFTFDDESTQEFNAKNCSEQTNLRAMIHGYSQKIGDSYAGAAKAEGMTPLAFAKLAVKETIAQLYAGEWKAPRVAGEKVSDLAIALSRLTGKTLEEAHAFVERAGKEAPADGQDEEEVTEDERKAFNKVWRSKGKVAAMLANIAAEKAAERAKRLAAKAGAITTAEGEEEAEEEITLG